MGRKNRIFKGNLKVSRILAALMLIIMIIQPIMEVSAKPDEIITENSFAGAENEGGAVCPADSLRTMHIRQKKELYKTDRILRMRPCKTSARLNRQTGGKSRPHQRKIYRADRQKI